MRYAKPWYGNVSFGIIVTEYYLFRVGPVVCVTPFELCSQSSTAARGKTATRLGGLPFGRKALYTPKKLSLVQGC